MTVSPERILVIRNPVSPHAGSVQRFVMNPLYTSGHHVTELKIPSANRAEIIDAISEAIQPGDKIIVAAGDGTGNATANAYMQADSEGAEIGFLAYGNFNDMAATFTARSALMDPLELLRCSEVIDTKPLEVSVNDEHYRYAMLYATLGWTALAAALFDNPQTRATLGKRRAQLAFSLTNISKMYFKTRSTTKLPPFWRDGDGKTQTDVTDVLAVNGPIMAQIIRSHRNFYEEDHYLRSDLNVAKLLANASLLGRSGINLVTGTRLTLPGSIVGSDTLHFGGATVPLQLDGEFEQLDDIQVLRISKESGQDAKSIKVMKSRARQL